MRRRVTVFTLLAIAAALLWAPLTVSAGSENTLWGAAVSPPSGTTATAFVLSVRYQGPTGATAGAITATVAGRSLPMRLVAGSATDGSWAASATLPAGAWTTRFVAAAPSGADSTLTGPSVTVVDAAPASAAPTAFLSPLPAVKASPGDSSLPVAEPQPSAPTPAAAPAATASPASIDATAATASPASTARPADAAPATSTPATRPTAAAQATGGAAGAGASGVTGSPDTAARSPAPSGGGANAVPRASPAATGAAEGQRARDAAAPGLTPTMLAALFAMTFLAAVGVAFILLAARRRSAETASVVSPRREPRREPGLTSSMEAMLAERAARRGRIRAVDDPILRGMGLDQDGEPRAGRPGEPPRRAPRRPGPPPTAGGPRR